ncbi:MAG TPA: SCE4755 family polysaccharide monooxygenase-like protein, partial [Polyangiaceae bacterium]|nr:SCE4755 family polysaccharide monooxygenase-like protein [Polyangiaceae bacterium]
MRAQTVVSLAALLGPTLIASLASAHIGLSAPLARAQAPMQGNVKNAPCGQTTDGRTSGVTVFQPGQVVTVTWVEYVNHPSYFRVAFQPDGDSFPMRQNVPQSNSVPETADQQQSAEEAVFAGSTAQLLAVVQDNNTSTTAPLSTQVTLPNTPCENCTLQVVQVMYNNPPQDGGGYYQCADIAIRGSGDTTGSGGSGTTGSTDEQPPAAEPDAGTGSGQNGDVSSTAAPGAGMSNAGSGTKSVGSGANGEGASAAPPGTTSATAAASAASNSAETAMGVSAGTSASNSATPAASAPLGGSAVNSESSGGGGGGCSLG